MRVLDERGYKNTMVKIAICDDSEITISQAENMLEKLKIKDLEYDSFYSGEELLKHANSIDSEKYDIFLLDIEMGELSGLETAKELRKKFKESIIIFITSHNEFVYDAFEVLAFNFIVKPLTLEKLSEVLDKALKYHEIMGRIFVFKYNNVEKSIHTSDIIYFESEKRKMIIHTSVGDFCFYDKVSDTYEKLEKTMFAQTHVSYIINMKYIDEVAREYILLTNGKQIPISNRYREDLKTTYHAYLRRKM